jgi:hypothetical protein
VWIDLRLQNLQYCVSGYVRKDGVRAVIDHLRNLGGSPLLDGPAWNEKNFNVSKIIELEPHFGILFLLDFEFKSYYAPDGWNKSHHIPSLIKEGVFSWEERANVTFHHYNQMVSEMYELQSVNSVERDKLEANTEKAVNHLRMFSEVQKHDDTLHELH